MNHPFLHDTTVKDLACLQETEIFLYFNMLKEPSGLHAT